MWLTQDVGVVCTSDASSSNEAVHLQQRLKSLSSELVTLRNRLHVSEAGHPPSIPQQHGSSPQQASSGAPAPRAHLAPSKPHNVQDHGPGQQPEPPPPVHSPGQQQAPAAFSTQQGHKDTNKHAGVGQQGIPAPPPHGYSQDVGKVSKTGVSGGGAGHFIKPTACTEVRDLIHLPGPLTEDAVLRTLHARFFSREYFTNVGPILVSVNAFQDVGNPLTLRSAHASSRCPQLLQVVQEAARQQAETGYPQAIILSGENGSGKTYASMLLLRQLFDVAGGGSETDAFKHLAAAFTVLRSLGSAKTAANAQSSRIVSHSDTRHVSL